MSPWVSAKLARWLAIPAEDMGTERAGSVDRENPEQARKLFASLASPVILRAAVVWLAAAVRRRHLATGAAAGGAASPGCAWQPRRPGRPRFSAPFGAGKRARPSWRSTPTDGLLRSARAEWRSGASGWGVIRLRSVRMAATACSASAARQTRHLVRLDGRGGWPARPRVNPGSVQLGGPLSPLTLALSSPCAISRSIPVPAPSYRPAHMLQIRFAPPKISESNDPNRPKPTQTAPTRKRTLISGGDLTVLFADPSEPEEGVKINLILVWQRISVFAVARSWS